MLRIKQMQMKVILDKEDANKLLDDLSENYDLMIYEGKKEYLDRLGLDISDSSYVKEKLYPSDTPILGGDIVYLPPDSMLYYKINENSETIEVGVIGDVKREEFEEFALHVKTSIYDALDDPDMSWEPVKEVSSSFKMLIENGTSVVPKEKEIEASTLLAKLENRRLMEVIMEEESIILDKLAEEVKRDDLEEAIKVFEDMGLITTDFSLLCSKTGQQILKVPDKPALEDMAKKGFKCFICGNSIADEKLVRLISCSDFGRKMLKDDYWFLVLTLNALNTIGIRYEDMFIVTGDSPDIKIFLDVNDEGMMIQLVKRKLSLDDAYLINAHISAYKLQYVILVSTTPLSLLMKSHLREVNPSCKISFIEGIEDLKSNIEKVTIEHEKDRLCKIMEDFSTLTPLPVEDLVMKKILPQGLTEPETGLEEDLFAEAPDAESTIIEESPEDEIISDDSEDFDLGEQEGIFEEMEEEGKKEE